MAAVEPTRDEVERGAAALVPFVRAWRLSLNPENLELMAYAVLVHSKTDVPIAEIDTAVADLIKDDHDAAHRLYDEMRRHPAAD